MKHHLIPYDELGISPNLILSDMGYGRIVPEEAVWKIMEELLHSIQQNVHPECAFRIYDGVLSGPDIQLGSKTLHAGEVINSLLKNAGNFAVFVATAGHRFEQMMQDVKAEGDMLKAYMMDIIGSRIAESAGDRMEQYLEEVIGRTAHTNRFSPGYCGWLLEEQEKLFDLLGGNPCEISLSDVFLMTPIKSISGIIGIGEHVGSKVYACHVCELTTCYKRKEKVKQYGH